MTMMLNPNGHQHRYSDGTSQSNNKAVNNINGIPPSTIPNIPPSSSLGQIHSQSSLDLSKQQQQQQQHLRVIPQRERIIPQPSQQYSNIQQHQEPNIHSTMQLPHHSSFTYERLPTAPVVPSTMSGGQNYYNHERYPQGSSNALSQQQQQQQHFYNHQHTPPRPHQRQKSAGTNSNTESASGRPYRSRKDRPCDSCRKRKSRCIIEESGQDCQSCRMNGRDCTFEMSPTPRSRPVKNEDGVTISSVIVPRKRSHSSQKGESLSPSDSQQNTSTSMNSVSEEFKRKARANSNLDHKVVQVTRRRSSCRGEGDVTAIENVVKQADKNSNGSIDHNQGNSKNTINTSLNNLVSPPSVPSSLPSGQTSKSQLAEIRPKDKVDTKMSKEKTKSDLLYDLVSAVMFKDDVIPVSNATGEDEPLTKSGNDGIPEEQEVGKEMTTVVLGSSASEDPQLLRQAGSPGSTQLSSKTNMNTNNETTSNPTNSMPPPLLADVQPTSICNNSGQNSVSPPKSYPLQVRQMNGDPYNPVFFAFVPAHPYGRSSNKTGSQIGAPGYTKLKEALHSRIGQLMVLYSQRDSAAFPILFEGQRRKFRQSAVEALKPNSDVDVPLPLVLATATLATATVYDASLRPISKQAWGSNLHALIQQFDYSTLTTIQVALTDLTGRPSINTSGNIMTFNQTLAISHTLGLHLDPTNWTIPNEEKDVRIRLWWATMIHDKWSSLCWGRPSTIHSQDYTVPLPRKNGFSPCSEHLEDKELKKYKFGTGWQTNESAHTPGDTFSGLCRLTLILSEILAEFYSVRGVHVMHRNSFTVSQKVKAYLVQLEDWMDLLPTTLKGVLKGDEGNVKGCQSIPGTRSLQLSYLGVLLLLCRTLLDSVTTKGTQESERHIPAHKTSLHGCLMMIEYLESLDDNDYGGFFLHYGSHHIASCLSLLARLCYGFARLKEEELLHTSITCMSRLLVTLSDAHRLYKWDLAELALTRSRAILPAVKASIPQWTKVFGESLLPLSSEDGKVMTANEEKVVSKQDGQQTNENTTNSVSSNKVFLRREGNGTCEEEIGSENVNSNPLQNVGIGSNNHLSSSSSSSHANPRFGGGLNGIHNPSLINSNNVHVGLGTPIAGNGTANNLHPYMGSGPYASIPIDAAGLPYPIGMNNSANGGGGGGGSGGGGSGTGGGIPNGNTLTSPVTGNGTTGASHLLSSMEVDWLALGLEPNTYSEYFVNSSFINHLGGSGSSDGTSMGNS